MIGDHQDLPDPESNPPISRNGESAMSGFYRADDLRCTKCVILYKTGQREIYKINRPITFLFPAPGIDIPGLVCDEHLPDFQIIDPNRIRLLAPMPGQNPVQPLQPGQNPFRNLDG